MRTTAISVILLALPAFLLADDKKDPELVKVYCFSEDLQVGFKDKTASYFCKELGNRGSKKKSLVLVDSEQAANVTVQFLGKERTSAPGETTFVSSGYAWTPDQLKDGARALLSIGDYEKGFYAEGLNDSTLMLLWNKTEEWLRDNRETILEKAQAQQ